MLVELSFLITIFLSFFFIFFKTTSNTDSSPKSYPLIGSFLAYYTNRHRLTQWTSYYVRNSPTLTILLRRPFGQIRVITGNPQIVQHILKNQFSMYQKGDIFHNTLYDLLGDGIFNVDGDEWKFQRQVSSHEFNTKSLRHFVEHVVDSELNERLIPILKSAVVNDTTLDLQDILQRFAFDNICRIAFGYDPKYLAPSLPKAQFAIAFEDAVIISSERFRMISPLLWKLKRFLNIGSEKRLKEAVSEIRQFATKILNEKKQELSSNSSSIQSVDLLSRFLSSGHSDEKFVTDIVISFILAGRDTTSAAMTWFFWLIYKNPDIESKIVNEINAKSDSPIYDEVKDMVYTHASLCESMRLYPPVPVDSKIANVDDVLPDGTAVKKGTMVSYHPYAMGRVEKFWGKDWKEFRPERWLEKDETMEKVKFVARDPYIYPVFQAGPRICLGKDMAFLQMKRVVAGVLQQFKVVSAIDDSSEPVFITNLTMKMKDGFPVKIKERK
ncbi:cytochrome P450 94A1-like [Rutidosis leptorrhynchoides]|uniref:cytochrome P450 94A1-like n=1 Tax=Rutidosis leptorrhynchoides TaxID=125765 RepID=UPI003A9A484A